MKDKHSDGQLSAASDKPPFFKSWKGMYWLVLGNLAFLIILFYIITRIYS
ncbi:hypothetical protein [Pontibacter ramchanderi]|uniref:Uncharacterized protein n=1 Tax=Pontibacter ramchanderi TaxID=1179743 RepID=A0A2N3U950_9BACT|nr:hypothetical protein [Pontibacter ramchanderi]PKV63271.1 hypothetical protein BD749_3111 [Pontibacter ramchanderi]